MRFNAFLVAGVLSQTLMLAQGVETGNLKTCLSGKFPSLCDHSTLTPEQLQQVIAAEKRENLRLCMTGKYPTLCDHAKLSAEETSPVQQAERLENLRLCMTGRYRTLCNHRLLSPSELAQVNATERAENLKLCMDGRYPSLCDHKPLTAEQARLVAAAEAKVAASSPRPRVAPRASVPGGGDCESGHWIDSVLGDGKVIKLEDGSMWEVDEVDAVTTSIWLPITDVIVCGTQMINVDDGESVQVTRIGRSPSGSAGGVGPSHPSYVVQASANDETFVVNGEVFKAKTYCFNFEQGDTVIFLEGSPLGACVSAKLLNLRTKKVCDVWCE